MRTIKLLTLGAILLIFSAFVPTGIQHIPLFTYAGLPQASDSVKVLYNTGFITGYSEEMKNPLWTCYRLGNFKGDYDTIVKTKWERPRGFRVDYRTDARVAHEDYTGSGYDRGHMAPNSAITVQYGHLAQIETYLMTNICPQHKDLNRNIWRLLEVKAREEISQNDSVFVNPNSGKKSEKHVHDLFVITGPVFDKMPADTLDSGIPIPTRFYKIFVYQYGYFATPKAVAFLMPQHPDADSEFLDYAVSVDSIETVTGIDFFTDLSDTRQRNLESVKRNFLLETID